MSVCSNLHCVFSVKLFNDFMTTTTKLLNAFYFMTNFLGPYNIYHCVRS